MKTNKERRSSIRKIHSMHELQMEKARMKLELVKKEGDIKANYHQILSAFSLGNILSTVTTEFISPSSIVSKAFTLGKNWLSKRKKKKKEKEQKVKAVKVDETVKSEE
jgi:hypothetical protein